MQLFLIHVELCILLYVATEQYPLVTTGVQTLSKCYVIMLVLRFTVTIFHRVTSYCILLRPDLAATTTMSYRVNV